MSTDYYMLISFWLAFPFVLWKAVPRTRIREAIATFLFFQMLTWLFSIGLTHAGLLESPIRFFKYATKISFTMEYVVFPTFAVLFQMNFPTTDNFIIRMYHYLLWVGIILSFMFLAGIFTNIMDVNLENLLRSFFNFLIELWICHRYVMWILKDQAFREGTNIYEN